MGISPRPDGNVSPSCARYGVIEESFEMVKGFYFRNAVSALIYFLDFLHKWPNFTNKENAGLSVANMHTHVHV